VENNKRGSGEATQEVEDNRGGSVRQCAEWKSDKRTIEVEQGMGGSAEGNNGED
jgi:hypothetical protein